MTDSKSYFAAATSWATQDRDREARSSRVAWTIAGVAAGIAMFEAVALALLTPLKTVQPVTILVDRQTGFVQTLDPQTPKRVRADEALTTSMLARYVSAREEFDRATVANDYQHVALWSIGPARSQYLAQMLASNSASPLQRYSAGTIVTAHVKSVSYLSPGTALVRFDTQQQNRAGQSSASQAWIAVVRYRYTDGAMSFENRLVNPLGFQVTSYRRDAEALGQTDAPTAPSIATRPSAAITASPKAMFPAAGDRINRFVSANQLSETSQLGLVARGAASEQIPSGSPLVSLGQSVSSRTSGVLR